MSGSIWATSGPRCRRRTPPVGSDVAGADREPRRDHALVKRYPVMPMCVPVMDDGVRLALMTETPTRHLTVRLPGVGKTLARQIAHEDKAVLFTPGEWMIPLFGTTWREPDADGKRDVLEGRLLWAAREVLGVGGSVVLDFGCWQGGGWAVRAVAEHAGGHFRLHFVDLPEAERRARATARSERDPVATFEISPGAGRRPIPRLETGEGIRTSTVGADLG
jgi:predicted kinase